MGGGRGQHAFKLKKKFMEVGLGSEVYKSNFCVLQVCCWVKITCCQRQRRKLAFWAIALEPTRRKDKGANQLL